MQPKTPAIFTFYFISLFQNPNCLLFISSSLPLHFCSKPNQSCFRNKLSTTYTHLHLFFMSVCEKGSSDLNSPTAAQSQRAASKKKCLQNDTPFRGVRKRRWGRYVSEIRLPGQKTRIWLGSFRSPEMAARAYDSAAYFLKGDSAFLNFPDLMGSLPRPESCSRTDIQSAAAKAALQEPVGNNIGIGARFEGSCLSIPDEDTKCVDWWDELGISTFDEELSPLRFDSMDKEFFSFMDHDDDFLISCFPF